MNTETGGKRDSRSAALGSLVDGRRRTLLSILLGRVSPASERELAVRLVAAEEGTSLGDVSTDAARSAYAGLQHVHLPSLADAGLVDWDRDEGTVATTGHPALRDPDLLEIVETEAENWDAVVDAVAHRQRRIVLSVLADASGPLSRGELARALAARDVDSERDSVEVRLHHCHLPKLADAGLVEYDADAGAVSYVGHPDLREEWLTVSPDETRGSALPAAP